MFRRNRIRGKLNFAFAQRDKVVTNENDGLDNTASAATASQENEALDINDGSSNTINNSKESKIVSKSSQVTILDNIVIKKSNDTFENEKVEKIESSTEVQDKSLTDQPQPAAASQNKPNILSRRNFIKRTPNFNQASRPKKNNAVQNNSEKVCEAVSNDSNITEVVSSSSVETKLVTKDASDEVRLKIKDNQEQSDVNDKNCVDEDSNVEQVPLLESPSPIKQGNRTRIKAIPMLGQRGSSNPSFSQETQQQMSNTSESEDDTKKRPRLESSSETAASVTASPHKEHKKVKRNNQSRKLADAKRQFQNRFGNDIPDRDKLTMLDLIFYNPTANPMTNSAKKVVKKRTLSEAEVVDNPDDPVEEEAETEQPLPTPRIRIGEDGEIEIDESSLFVENKALKKRMQEFSKSEIIDEDLYKHNPAQKKAKRSKEWTEEETIIFYKALSVLGSDFTTMVQLFPDRTRKELKTKFQKEDKINCALIDKALANPIKSDFNTLKKEIEERRNEIKTKAEKAKRAEELVVPTNKLASSGLKFLKRCSQSKRKQSIKKQSKPRFKKKNNALYTKLQKGFTTILDSDSDDEDFALGNDPNIDVKSTRSGRIPKISQSFGSVSSSSTNSNETSTSKRGRPKGKSSKNQIKEEQNEEHKENKTESVNEEPQVESKTCDNELPDKDFDESLQDADSSENENRSDTEEIIDASTLLKPTRYGRVPKPTQTLAASSYEDNLYDPSVSMSIKRTKRWINTVDDDDNDENQEDEESAPLRSKESTPELQAGSESASKDDVNVSVNHISNLTENPPTLETGSIMIISSMLPSGEETYQVFMVAPKNNQESDVETNMEPTANDENPENERNITIPAEPVENQQNS